MTDQDQRISIRRERAILVVVGLSTMMVVSAVSGLNVALPSLAEQTGATQSQLQWVVDAYTVAFAGLLLFTGAVGDRYGRRGTLLVGLGLFGTAALIAVFVNDPNALIGLRALMGVGAAFTMPTTLSIITTNFPEERRGHAVGMWVGMAGGGAVIGLFGSALLLTWFAWNSFFVLNVALAVTAFAGALFLIPSSRSASAPPLDAVSGLLSLIGVTGIVLGVIEGPVRGWTDALVWCSIGFGLLALMVFVWREHRKKAPMLDPRLFLLRGVGIGSLSLTVQFCCAFGFFFISLQYLQFVVGFSPLIAACCLLPMPFVLLPLSRISPRLAERYGFGRIGALGLSLMAVGFFVFSQLQVNFSYWVFGPGLVLFAMGMGLAGPPGTTAIVSSLPQSKQGVASAVNDTTRELGSALGIAILGSVLNSEYRNGMAGAVSNLPADLADKVLGSIAFVQFADRLGSAGEQLATAARQAFVAGVFGAVVVAASLLVVTSVVVLLLGPRPQTDFQASSPS